MLSPRPSDVPPRIRAVIRSLAAAGYEAWLVGGAVRDLCRGKPAKDFDLATSATPDEMRAIFGARRTIPTGEKHGTMTILVDREDGEREPVEVTTYRGEGSYSDGRHPDAIAFVRSIEEDLARRDFTMNALAYDPERDELRDLFDGRGDLARGIVRAVGDPVKRFSEDGLRAMRAVRFCAQLEMKLDAATEAAIPATIAVFRRVSAERVRDELLKILSASKPSIGLGLLATTGLLHEIMPELEEGIGFHQNRHHAHDVWEHTLATVDAARLVDDPSPWIVRLGALLHDVAKPRTAAPKEGEPGEHTFYRHDVVGAEVSAAICERLRLSNHDRDRVCGLVLNHMFWYTPEWSDGTVRRFITRVGADQLRPLFLLREADVVGRGRGEDPGTELSALQTRVAAELEKASALKVGDLAIRGADVIKILARPPGPIVGEVLRRLLERVLDDPSLNTAEQLAALVPEIASAVAP